MAREAGFSLPYINLLANRAKNEFPQPQTPSVDTIDILFEELKQNGSALILPEIPSKTRLANLGPILSKLQPKLSSHPAIAQWKYEQAKATELNLSPADLLAEADQSFDASNSVDNDPLDSLLPMMLREPDLNREFWQIADASVRQKSNDTLRKLDSRPNNREPDCDILIVGDNITASQISTQLGPYYKIWCVTDQRHISATTRFRPVFANSSVLQEDIRGVPLPTLNNGTTPVSTTGFLHAVRPGQLTTPGDLRVTCDDGSTRQYSDFKHIGDATGVNILSYTDAQLIEQTANIDSLKLNRKGYPTVEITGSDGTVRRIASKKIIFATGPGTDISPLSNASLEIQISNRTRLINEKADNGQPYSLSELKKLSKIRLPQSITLGDISKLLEFWHCELKSEADLYPLKELFDPNLQMLIGGNGDSALCIQEFFAFKAPAWAYPPELTTDDSPYTLLVGPRYDSEKQISAKTRLRYAQNRPNKEDEAHFVLQGKLSDVSFGRMRGVYATILTPRGQDQRFFDYYFPAIGLKPNRVPSGFNFIYEPNSTVPFARINGGEYAFLAGTAARLFSDKDTLPSRTRKLFEAIGTPENSLAAFLALLGNINLSNYIEDSVEPNIDQLRKLIKNQPQKLEI